jgi:hypothetical protein
MTKMRTVDAAIAILEKEGATEAFGLPGAAINPFYSAMRAHGGVRHTLARRISDLEVLRTPVADGGEGTLDAAVESGFTRRSALVSGRPGCRCGRTSRSAAAMRASTSCSTSPDWPAVSPVRSW